MRRALESIGTPDHLALAYDGWAPVDDSGKVPDGLRADWLSRLAGISVSPDYRASFERWRMSFSPPDDRIFELELAGRLLVGHGNSSATDIGITVHHTWGVPVIPGSALKGLAAHFVDAVYGPVNPARKPWEQEREERTRTEYQGVTWRGTQVQRGPGAVYRALFGSPDAQEDDEMRERGFIAGASVGLVAFHDALYVPEQAADDKPFTVDVVTVHQKRYYDSLGQSWPNDYDSLNPVAFLTVRPGVRFLVALSGPPDWTELAERLVRDALEKWGVGSKTAAGYGRLVPHRQNVTATGPAGVASGSAVPRAGDRVEATLLEERTKKGGWKARHEPSGLSGPIQNSGEVPPTANAGDRLMLVVASVTTREIAFRFPSAAQASRAKRREQ